MQSIPFGSLNWKTTCSVNWLNWSKAFLLTSLNPFNSSVTRASCVSSCFLLLSLYLVTRSRLNYRQWANHYYLSKASGREPRSLSCALAESNSFFKRFLLSANWSSLFLLDSTSLSCFFNLDLTSFNSLSFLFVARFDQLTANKSIVVCDIPHFVFLHFRDLFLLVLFTCDAILNLPYTQPARKSKIDEMTLYCRLNVSNLAFSTSNTARFARLSWLYTWVSKVFISRLASLSLNSSHKIGRRICRKSRTLLLMQLFLVGGRRVLDLQVSATWIISYVLPRVSPTLFAEESIKWRSI